MSNTQFAFLKKENVPAKEQWQKAIDDLNFDIRLGLDPELAPFEDEGFSPCQWGESDDDVGFEIYYESARAVVEDDANLKQIAGDNDYCIGMCWYGSMKDCAAVMIASCALAKEFGAVVSYEGNPAEDLGTLVGQTREIIGEAESEEAGENEADEAELSQSLDFTAIARQVLQSVKENFPVEHEFVEAIAADFDDLDSDFYQGLQSSLEALGFTWLCDVEDRTISEQGGIKTMIRTMRQPDSGIIAAFYYIPLLGAGFFDMESFLSDGTIVLTTTAPEANEISRWPKIVARYVRDIDAGEMLQIHQQAVEQACAKESSAYSLKTESFADLVARQNDMNRHKHETLEAIGWVTREYLLAQTDGDEVIADGVYQAVKKLVAED